MSGRAFAIALGTSALWAIYLIMTRHVVGSMRLDSWAYTLVQLLSAGLLMFWLGRNAPGAWRDLLAPWTIIYTLVRVVIVGSTAASIVWLAVSQSTLIATVSVLLGALSGWGLHRLAPRRAERVGLILLAVGLGTLVVCLTPDTAWRGAVWTLVSESAAVAGAWMIAAHPRNRSTDIAERSRFTGEMLFVTSLALIVGWSLIGAIGLTRSPWAAAGDAFGNPDVWIYGALAGLIFRGPGTWLSFWSINATGVQAFLIALTAIPFISIAFESVAGTMGWVAPPALSPGEWIGAALILAASVWLIIVRLKASPAGAS